MGVNSKGFCLFLCFLSFLFPFEAKSTIPCGIQTIHVSLRLFSLSFFLSAVLCFFCLSLSPSSHMRFQFFLFFSLFFPAQEEGGGLFLFVFICSFSYHTSSCRFHVYINFPSVPRHNPVHDDSLINAPHGSPIKTIASSMSLMVAPSDDSLINAPHGSPIKTTASSPTPW